MKKIRLIILTFTLMLAGASAFANPKIDFRILPVDDDQPNSQNQNKVPARKPSVWQEDYQIEFQGSHAEYVLNIVDGDEVVYTTVVSSCETVIYLPSWLSGEYEIQLVQGRFMFVGNIEL